MKDMMSELFIGPLSFKFDDDLSKWDVSIVTDMNRMFGYSKCLDGGDMSKWDASSVNDMSSMSVNA